MSDARTTELHRAYLVSGSTSDLVALLSARLRDGSLSRGGVELAAYLGHEAAREVVPFVVLDPHDVAYATLAELRWPGHLQVRDMHPIAEWVQGLGRYGRDAARRAAMAAAEAAYEVFAAHCADTVLHETMQAARDFVLDPTPENHRRVCGLAHGETMNVPHWVPCGCYLHDGVTYPMRGAANATSPEAIRSAVLRDVAPWALGLSDPLRDQARAARPDP